MKIVGIDNLNRETESDHLLLSHIPDTDENRSMAKAFCEWINTMTCHGHGGTYYVIKENDYRLSRGMEDLV